jgi:hypothetical protein
MARSGRWPPGARLHTIIKMLGHTSTEMTRGYAHLSDRVVGDYQRVLGPGAVLAGTPPSCRLGFGRGGGASGSWRRRGAGSASGSGMPARPGAASNCGRNWASHSQRNRAIRSVEFDEMDCVPAEAS